MKTKFKKYTGFNDLFKRKPYVEYYAKVYPCGRDDCHFYKEIILGVGATTRFTITCLSCENFIQKDNYIRKEDAYERNNLYK